jgi:kynurenine formamidase
MAGNNWGRWGADDEAGALNLIGPAEVLAAAALVRHGTIVVLGQQLGPRTAVPPHRKRVERFMTRDGGDYAAGARRPNGFQFAEDVISFASHTGTHVDALSHAWCADKLYNGFPGDSVRSTTGAQRCSAAALRPVVTRGVLLDIAALRGRPLAADEPVTADDLQEAAQLAGTSLRPGDAVLIRTGWLGEAGLDESRYFHSEPGIDEGAAQRLADSDVAIVGADNYAVEVQPAAPGTSFPVHQLLIRDHGVPLIEGLRLDSLAGAADPFLFVAVPLPVEGGTAGPVCPIAIL